MKNLEYLQMSEWKTVPLPVIVEIVYLHQIPHAIIDFITMNQLYITI